MKFIENVVAAVFDLVDFLQSILIKLRRMSSKSIFTAFGNKNPNCLLYSKPRLTVPY